LTKKLHLISLGCTKNLVDSEVMLGKLRDYKLVDDASISDVIIINTCGFIDSAKEESINTILNIHNIRKNDSILVVTGCLSERYREELQKELPEVDIFTGVGDYEKIDELIALKENRFSNKVYLADENSNRVITGSLFHAYIKISEGCNQICSFCAIPSFKGKLHSRSLDSIKKEVKKLVENGYYDFSFISQDSSSYGRDIGLNNGLINLIEMIENIDGVKTAKILYLYPSTTTIDLIDKIANSKVFETYYDMPIQHIADSMLLKMRRGISEEKILKLLERMKSHKNSMIRSAIIVGHPTETNKEFKRICEFVKNFEFDRLTIFEYSHEENTKSYTMKQIDTNIISERANILGKIVSQTNIKSLKNMINRTINIVINGESIEHKYLLSARPLQWAFEIDGDILINDTNELQIKYGKIYKAQITELVGDKLLARLI
jgi:ribosomal protein S12 methylthiotransferase RimO